MPWHALSTIPTNANTGLRYSGINVLTLWAIAANTGYSTQLWATYRQWQEMGAQVRPGSEICNRCLWKFYSRGRKNASRPTQMEAVVYRR